MRRLGPVFVSILMFYACWYVQAFDNIPIVVKGSAICALLCLLAYVSQQGFFLVGNVPMIVWKDVFIGGYCLVTGVFVSYDLSSMFSSLLIFVSYSVVMIVACYYSSEMGSIDWFLDTFILIALLCGIHALMMNNRYFGYGLRLGKQNNIHSFALVMDMGILASALKCKNNTKSFLIYLGAAVFMLYCIVESSSRKCLLAALILLAIWIISFGKELWIHSSKSIHILILISVMCIGFFAVYFFRNYYIHTESYGRMQTFAHEESNTGRIEMYKIALRIFLDKPLFGGGYDQFQYWSELGSYSHSVYAESIADFGFIGSAFYLIPYGMMTIKQFSKAFFTRKNYQSRILFGACIMELFLGIGQIYFDGTEHLAIWAIISWIDLQDDRTNPIKIVKRGSKYEKA